MALKSSSTPEIAGPVGVIGSGSFGRVVANLLANNVPVMLYARSESSAQKITDLHNNVQVVTDPQQLAENCEVIFPMVPSVNFREMMREFAPHLHPYHILIHGTKGLDLNLAPADALNTDYTLRQHEVCTMSEVIQQESVVVRIGCLAGPNLAKELAEGLPAATVIASRFQEVIAAGQNLLRNDLFQVYGSNDLIGIELCGVLKNIIAIAAGMLNGLNLGENARALLISRGLVEMIYLGQALGGDLKAFIGLAGVGDLVATSNSTTSRNFTVGRKLAEGKSLDTIREEMEETAEGINTVQIVKKLAATAGVRAPITETMHRVLYSNLSASDAIASLMKVPIVEDVNFL